MKTLFALIALTLVSAPALAAPISCKTANAGPDHGTYATFNSDRSQAVVSRVTIRGYEVIARLECFRSVPRGGDTDLSVTLTKCSEPVLTDAGYSLVLKRGSIVGKYVAVLNAVTIEGEKKLTTMNCVQAMN